MASLLNNFPFETQYETSYEGRCRLKLINRGANEILTTVQRGNFEIDPLSEIWLDCICSNYLPSNTLLIKINTTNLYSGINGGETGIEYFFNSKYEDLQIGNFFPDEEFDFIINFSCSIGDKILVLGELSRGRWEGIIDLERHEEFRRLKIYENFQFLLQFDYSDSLKKCLTYNLKDEKSIFLNHFKGNLFTFNMLKDNSTNSHFIWNGLSNIFYLSSEINVDDIPNDYTDINYFKGLKLEERKSNKCLSQFHCKLNRGKEKCFIKIDSSQLNLVRHYFPKELYIILEMNECVGLTVKTNLRKKEDKNFPTIYASFMSVFCYKDFILLFGFLNIEYDSEDGCKITDIFDISISFESKDTVDEVIHDYIGAAVDMNWYITDYYDEL